MPERRLDYYLNKTGKKVKEFSVGTVGYGQDQQLLALRDYYKEFRSNLVVLWQTPTNDIWNNIFPTHWPTNANPKPTFWLEKGNLKGPTENIGDNIVHSRIKILSLMMKLSDSVTKRDSVWEERLPPAYVAMSTYSGKANHDWQHRWDNDIGLMRGENLGIEKSHFAMYLTPRSKRMQYGLDLTKMLMKEMRNLTESNGSEFFVFRATPPDSRVKADETVHELNGKYYRTSGEQYNRNLSDLDAGFKNIEANITLDHWRVGPNDSHLNEEANDEAMRLLSDKLAPMIPNRD